MKFDPRAFARKIWGSDLSRSSKLASWAVAIGLFCALQYSIEITEHLAPALKFPVADTDQSKKGK